MKTSRQRQLYFNFIQRGAEAIRLLNRQCGIRAPKIPTAQAMAKVVLESAGVITPAMERASWPRRTVVDRLLIRADEILCELPKQPAATAAQQAAFQRKSVRFARDWNAYARRHKGLAGTNAKWVMKNAKS